MMATELNERLLPDDYPVYGGYLYVADGKVIMCDLVRGTIKDLKKDILSYTGIEVKDITNCDIEGRRNLNNP